MFLTCRAGGADGCKAMLNQSPSKLSTGDGCVLLAAIGHIAAQLHVT